VFERFTDRARRVVVLAQEEARLLNHNYIGTEHLLLGLLHEGEGVAALALESLDVSIEAARAQVEDIIGHGGQAIVSGHIPFTPRAKKVLEFSLREAMQLGHNYIGTEHILLGLVREGEGVAAQVLAKLGADLSRVRQAVVEEVSSDMLTIEELPPMREPAPERPRLIVGGPRDGCMFCGRDLYEVERAVTNRLGALLCKDCASLAVQTMERAPAVEAPLQPLQLPPPVFGDRPGEQAVDEIAALFERWSTHSVADDLLEHVERGEQLHAVQAELRARWSAQAQRITYRIERLRFVSPDEAAVRFVISALPHEPFDGRAVRMAGTWKIGRETYCMVARLAGVQCPDADETGSSSRDE
jgi:hypothetical protein